VLDPDALVEALRGACRLHERRFVDFAAFDIGDARTEVLGTADVLYRWLTRPVTLTLAAGPAVNQTTGQPTTTPTGVPQMQLHDNEQVDLSVTTADAKGFATADSLTWMSSDESVATVTVSADSKTGTVVAGNPGSAVITVSDGTLSATEAIDVVPAGTATISIAEGTPVEQPVV
jgi:hypothetical protein